MFRINTINNAKIETDDRNDVLKIRFLKNSANDVIKVNVEPSFECDKTDYVFMPACIYNGNRFNSRFAGYPPKYRKDECKADLEPIITDVPRLNKDGSGRIEITSGDLSTVCVGIFSRRYCKCFFIFSIQEINLINLGISYSTGKLDISYPHYREETAYRWPRLVKPVDKPMDFRSGEEFEIPYRIIEKDCASIEEFYQIFFENRKCMEMNRQYPEVLPFSEQKKIQLDKFKSNWYENPGFYGVVPIGDTGNIWQPGWCGGSITLYCLLALGGREEEERALKTLDYLFTTQQKSGLFYANCSIDGLVHGKLEDGTVCDTIISRMACDILYYVISTFKVMKKRNIAISKKYIDGIRLLADRIVYIWEKYGQMGQLWDIYSGEIVVGGSSSASLAPKALIEAYTWFSDKRYFIVALDIGKYFYENFAAKGFTNGGPGDILQGIDSESCGAMLESMIAIYEATNDNIWLRRSQHLANMFSSWVVSYNYKFPEFSELHRLDKKTIGTVFANIQNKHSAPGACTLSMEAIYKIYTYTNSILYRDMFQEVAMTISQFMSTEKNPIYSWDVPKDASLINDDSIIVEREQLPSGYICERVNMSDWESYRCVGGVFNGSCWSEISNMLTIIDDEKYFIDSFRPMSGVQEKV
jgi:hypothetical protein